MVKKHTCNDGGRQFEVQEETKTKIITWLHTTCSVCGATTAIDKLSEVHK